MGASSLYYTPSQLRGTVGLSKEAFRHWKRVVPAFANGKGHAPSFSPGDVLASAVLRRLTDTGGVRIGHLSEVTPAIFEICNASSWEALQNKSLVIDLEKRTCVAATNPVRSAGDLMLVCALGSIVNALQRELVNSSHIHPTPRPSLSTGGQARKGGRG